MLVAVESFFNYTLVNDGTAHDEINLYILKINLSSITLITYLHTKPKPKKSRHKS